MFRSAIVTAGAAITVSGRPWPGDFLPPDERKGVMRMILWTDVIQFVIMMAVCLLIVDIRTNVLYNDARIIKEEEMKCLAHRI